MAAESIKVCCRFRMEFDHDESDYDEWNYNQETASISLLDKKWTYDYILPPKTTQEIMYDQVAKKTITDFIEGFHGTIFAYGQSGSGKTYSMLGPDSVFSSLTNENDMNELYGITPRAVYQIYEQLKEYSREGASWKLCLSYIEIYNEKLKCLLSNKEGLKIREDPVEGFIIPEKAIVDCKVPETVFQNIYLATNNRATGSTKQNERSSRSHAILQLELIFNSLEGVVRKSRLSLVDLAGSERIAKTNAEGLRLKEAQKINQSLTTLGMVIMALTTQGSKHVPFRNSKLTLILKDSLGGSSKTTLLCTASRLKKHKEESVQTLYFASRAKSIKNVAKQNVILNAGELQYISNGLKQELRILRGQIKRVGSKWNNIIDAKLLSFISNEDFEEDTSEEPLIKLSQTSKNPTKFLTSIIEEGSNKKAMNSEEIQTLKSNMETERLLLQKIIDELNEKVDKKDKEKEEINLKFNTYIDQINHLESIMQEKKKLEERIDEMILAHSSQNNKIENLQTQIQIFEIENENLNTTVEESEVTNLATYSKFQVTQRDLNGKIQEKNKAIYELEQKANDANDKVDTIEQIYDTKEKSLTTQLESAKLEIVKLNKMLNSTLTTPQVVIEKEYIYAQNMASLKSTNDDIMKENERLKKDILKMKLAFNSEKVNQKSQYEKQISELNNVLIEKSGSIEKLKDDHETMKNKTEAKEKQIDVLNKCISDKDKEIESLKEKLKVKVGVYIEENNEIKKELEEKKEALILEENKNNELLNTIEVLNNALKSVKAEAMNNSFTKTPTKMPFRSDSLLVSPIPIKKTKTLGASPVQNVFGVTLKKTTGTTDFLKLAKKESSLMTKQTELLFKDKLDMLTNLRSNMVYDSPHTVSSRSDIIDDELSILDFENEETFLKAEEKLLAKEIEYQSKKELRESIKK